MHTVADGVVACNVVRDMGAAATDVMAAAVRHEHVLFLCCACVCVCLRVCCLCVCVFVRVCARTELRRRYALYAGLAARLDAHPVLRLVRFRSIHLAKQVRRRRGQALWGEPALTAAGACLRRP